MLPFLRDSLSFPNFIGCTIQESLAKTLLDRRQAGGLASSPFSSSLLARPWRWRWRWPSFEFETLLQGFVTGCAEICVIAKGAYRCLQHCYPMAGRLAGGVISDIYLNIISLSLTKPFLSLVTASAPALLHSSQRPELPQRNVSSKDKIFNVDFLVGTLKF